MQNRGEQQQGLPQKRKERAIKKESCAWRRKYKMREHVLSPLKEIINVCVRGKKNKRDFSLTVKHIQELL